jgi:hypothetical protein
MRQRDREILAGRPFQIGVCHQDGQPHAQRLDPHVPLAALGVLPPSSPRAPLPSGGFTNGLLRHAALGMG